MIYTCQKFSRIGKFDMPFSLNYKDKFGIILLTRPKSVFHDSEKYHPDIGQRTKSTFKTSGSKICHNK